MSNNHFNKQIPDTPNHNSGNSRKDVYANPEIIVNDTDKYKDTSFKVISNDKDRNRKDRKFGFHFSCAIPGGIVLLIILCLLLIMILKSSFNFKVTTHPTPTSEYINQEIETSFTFGQLNDSKQVSLNQYSINQRER